MSLVWSPSASALTLKGGIETRLGAGFVGDLGLKKNRGEGEEERVEAMARVISFFLAKTMVDGDIYIGREEKRGRMEIGLESFGSSRSNTCPSCLDYCLLVNFSAILEGSMEMRMRQALLVFLFFFFLFGNRLF